MIALLLVIVTVALLQMQTMRDGTLDITDNWLPNVEVVNAMKTGLSNPRTYETPHVFQSASVTHPIDACHQPGQPGLRVLRTDESQSLQVRWRFHTFA